MKESKRFPNLWAEFKAQGRTLGRVARQIGVSPATLSNKMNGENEFKLKEMLALQFILGGLTLEYLFADPVEKEKAIARVDS